jgi:hypothetical protein
MHSAPHPPSLPHPPPPLPGGACPAGFTCSVDGSQCIPTSQPPNPWTSCEGVACGSVPTGDGGTYLCPSTCTESQTCRDNKCVPGEACAEGRGAGAHNAWEPLCSGRRRVGEPRPHRRRGAPHSRAPLPLLPACASCPAPAPAPTPTPARAPAPQTPAFSSRPARRRSSAAPSPTTAAKRCCAGNAPRARPASRARAWRRPSPARPQHAARPARSAASSPTAAAASCRAAHPSWPATAPAAPPAASTARGASARRRRARPRRSARLARSAAPRMTAAAAS